MDANEGDELLLAVLKELRRKNEREEQLRSLIAKVTDAVTLVNQTCVRVAEAVERLDARVTLLQPGPAE